MHDRIRVFACAALLIAATFFPSAPLPAQQSDQPIPPQLQLPVDEQLILQVHAKGVQIYSCKSESAEFHWTLKAPEAQLFDKKEQLIGRHFAGPAWQANDGSRITGKVAATAASPDAESIPWLLVKVVGHEGDGIFSRAITIQRLNTKGGKAPASGCDAGRVNQEVRVPYSADYFFYAPK